MVSFEFKHKLTPLEDLNKKQRDKIGIEYITHDGGILTIKGCYKDGDRYSYVGECSICSKDKELWPFGSIIFSTSAFNRFGTTSCGCGAVTKYKEFQNYVLAQRVCDKYNWKIVDWFHSNTRQKSSISLVDSSGYRWESPLYMFLSGHPRDSKLKAEASKKSYEQHIKDIKDLNIYPEGTEFIRGEGQQWYLKCPRCSNDEYVQEGVCSGVFEIELCRLKSGDIPCRCSTKYRYTKKQREYQINKICSEEGLSFLGWESRSHHNESGILWVCSCGSKRKTMLKNFLKGSRCTKCRVYGFNGFYPDKVNNKDFLYIIDFKDFIKVGRTFNLDTRLTQIKTLSKRNRACYIETFTSSHQHVYETEQFILNKFKSEGYWYETKWSTECLRKECLPKLMEILDKSGLVKME